MQSAGTTRNLPKKLVLMGSPSSGALDPWRIILFFQEPHDTFFLSYGILTGRYGSLGIQLIGCRILLSFQFIGDHGQVAVFPLGNFNLKVIVVSGLLLVRSGSSPGFLGSGLAIRGFPAGSVCRSLWKCTPGTFL